MKEEFELNGLLTYLSENNEQFLSDYLLVMAEEGRLLSNQEFNNLKKALYTLIKEISLTNEMYLKRINKEIKLAKFIDFIYNYKHNTNLFARVTPEYIEELMQVKKLISLMFEYLDKLTIDNNNFGLTDLFVISSAIMNLSDRRYKELQRQVNIFDGIEDHMMGKYDYKKNYSNSHVNESIDYLNKILKKSI
jgi:hypothetical protein